MVGDAQFLERMRTQRIVRHQLRGYRTGKRRIQATCDIDVRQFLVLMRGIGMQLRTLAREVGLLRIGLRTHRHILAGRHRHRAGDQPGNAGSEHRTGLDRRGSDPEQQ